MNKNYEVYCFKPDNPQHLAQWLEGILIESSLRLLATSGNYWIFEQTLLLDETAKIESLAQDAADSYSGFYDKAVIALGFSSASLPSEEMDQKMLKKISDLFWAVRTLSDALRNAYQKIPSHWREPLPFSYFEIMNRVKYILNDNYFVGDSDHEHDDRIL